MAERALRERIQQATGPDRELDYEIAIALGWERRFVSNDDDYWRKGDWSWTREDSEHPPRFTEHLHELLPLVLPKA